MKILSSNLFPVLQSEFRRSPVPNERLLYEWLKLVIRLERLFTLAQFLDELVRSRKYAKYLKESVVIPEDSEKMLRLRE